ncbi:MAG: bifunctional phosphoglucose/phosphomannose isomerase [Candidatus Thermoplasmatota archaeon]|nr:bifunctional phosphoglucose/phosphomannose isomerase [Candidatus Thermoplasmatota archaeon]MCG2827551.1 bifunctional phosphoglucose/phosphomannose isomerase [Thermoplasmatales archaeon]
MLDDIGLIKKIDSKNMIDIMKNFPEQIEDAVTISKGVSIPMLRFRNIVVTGMGGSAIGGDIMSSWLSSNLDVPIFVNRNYELPGFADKNTLLFAVSYSGNTDETVSSFLDGLNKNCNIVSITSGGRLAELSVTHKKPLIRIPSGLVPRAAVAYLLFPMIRVVERQGPIKLNLKEVISIVASLGKRISPDVDVSSNLAKQIAIKIDGKTPVIYGHTCYTSIARRWKTQFNENSKTLAFYDAIPEIYHNDIVGWQDDDAINLIPIILRDKNEPEKMKNRIEFIKKNVFKDLIEVWAVGNTTLSKMLYMLHLGDFVSFYLALLHNVDPTPVEIIERMKKETSSKSHSIPA